jgi:Skp family chaperone for outer membrane proteins
MPGEAGTIDCLSPPSCRIQLSPTVPVLVFSDQSQTRYQGVEIMKRSHTVFTAIAFAATLSASFALAEPKGKGGDDAKKEQMKAEREYEKQQRKLEKEQAKTQREMEHEEQKAEQEMEREQRKHEEEMAREERKHEAEMEREERKHDDQKEREYKEEGKGSEQGQTQREEVRKKWWKFWD